MEIMSTDAETEWNKVTQDMPKPVSEWWWSLILKKYKEEGREAHNLGLLLRKIKEIDNFRSNLTDVNAFVLALFFQYFHYQPNNYDFYSKNVESFKEFATEAGLSEDDTLYKNVKEMLESSSEYTTDEHTTPGAYGESDVHYFLDLDMLSLALEPKAYTEQVADVAKEYGFLDIPAYRHLRRRVLKSFLLIPNIFVTKLFRDKYEGRARANIQQELSQLG